MAGEAKNNNGSVRRHHPRVTVAKKAREVRPQVSCDLSAAGLKTSKPPVTYNVCYLHMNSGLTAK